MEDTAMLEEQGPPHHIPATHVVGENGRIELPAIYIGKQPKPGKDAMGGGFRVPPTRPGGMGSGITHAEGLRRETRDNIKATEASVKNEYAAKYQDLERSTEVDLANVRANFPAPAVSVVQAYQHELNIRNILIQQKSTEFHTHTVLANTFYGHSPLTTTIGDYLARAQALDRIVTPYGPAYSKWVVSYKAAFSAKLLTEQIQLLNNQQVHIQNLHASALMQEQRAAAEQARLAAEQRVQRAAAEQARIEAEAEQARLEAEAEAEVQRQAELLHLENERQAEEQALREAMESSNAVQSIRPFPVSGAAAANGAVFAVGAGTLAVDAATTIAIGTALRSAAAAAITASAAAVGTASGVVIVVGVAALVYYALRDKQEPHTLSVPLSDLTTYDTNELRAIAQANGEIELPVTIGSRTVDNSIEFSVAATNGNTVPRKVPVRLATYDPVLNIYGTESSGAQSPGMTWTPIVRPGNASTTLPVTEPDVAPYTGATATALEGRIDPNPELDLYSFGGEIYVFPVESGIPPQYVVFRDRRDDPGAGTGFGEPFSGIWLGSGADGAAIPSQIADKLRGRDFSSFRAFREALWKATASDPELSKQFRANNIEEMKNGRAPFARKIDRIGGQVKFELHHINHISKGGAVYDVDNIRVVTPKQHSVLHKGDK